MTLPICEDCGLYPAEHTCPTCEFDVCPACWDGAECVDCADIASRLDDDEDGLYAEDENDSEHGPEPFRRPISDDEPEEEE